MKLTQLGAGLGLMLMVAGAGAAMASPRDGYSRDRRPNVYRNDGSYRDDSYNRNDGRYRDDSYNRNDSRYRNDGDRQRRETLRSRVRQLTDLVQTTSRRDRLTDHDRRNLIDRLDRVGDFLRSDRNLSDDEYRRRMQDLDKIESDLRRAADRTGYGRRNDNRRDDYRRDDYRYRR
jgi:hypothetical protein